MYDQSFHLKTIEDLLQIGDERKYPSIKFEINKIAQLNAAVSFAHTEIASLNPLSSFQQSGRTVFQAKQLAHQLVLRKLSENLRYVAGISTQSRESIVSNLVHMLSEGVPYRIYRLDIKSFYESFSKSEVLDKVNSLNRLSPLTKRNIEILLTHHSSIGGQGIPRGLALSAHLSELMMKDFDTALIVHPQIYFSARYVDDIVILTDPSATEKSIFQYVKSLKFFPNGLVFNLRKTKVGVFTECVQPSKAGETPLAKPIELDYLGYNFVIKEPIHINKLGKNKQRRDVAVDIADSKSTRIKTRIIKSLLGFSVDKNFELLSRRLRFLTTNFSVRDAKTGRPNLAGIFYSYPLLTSRKKLKSLDDFLRCAVLSKTGMVFSKSGPLFSNTQKRELLRYSFVTGHSTKTFMHFNGVAIGEIQECWKYE
jgi:hypothetical protein